MACKTITKTLFTSSNRKNNKITLSPTLITLTPSLSEREINVRLTKIFTKIGQLDIAQQGIQDLYDFLIGYPECDVKVNAFLASAGTFFHKYINKRLAEITTREMKARGMIQQDSIKISNNGNGNNSIKSAISTTTISTSSIILSITKPTPLPISKKPKLHKINTSRFSSSSTSSNVSDRNGGDSETSSPYSSSGEYTPPSSPETTSPTLLSNRISREFKEKVSRETFEQTKSRLHKIFKYEEHKNGENVSSLATKLEVFQSDVEKLQFVKNIILSKPRLIRKFAWTD